MNSPGRFERLRSSFRGLGPLRPIAVGLVVVPAAGTALLLCNLAALGAQLPTNPALTPGVLVAAIAVATGGALVLPSAAAFAAGYVAGGFAGTGCAVLGLAIGSVLARQFLAPRLGPNLLAFMHGRPRAIAVRRFCRGSATAATLGVARLRWGSVFPHAVANVLFAVAAVPSVAVFRGSVLGALPGSLLAAVAGDCFRTWRATGARPEAGSWLAAAAAVLAVACLHRASRRVWRAQLPDGAAPSTSSTSPRAC